MKKKRNNDLEGTLKRRHICLFYDSQKDLLELAIPYFMEGLRANEMCIWVVSDLGIKGAKAALSKKVKNMDKYIKKGQLEIIGFNDWYLKSGKFNPKKVLTGWIEKEKQALRQGYNGLRASGDLFWLQRKDWGRWIHYETKVDKIIEKHKMTMLCTYPLNKFDLSDIFILSKNHRFAFSNKNGQWHILKNIKMNNLMANIKYYINDNR